MNSIKYGAMMNDIALLKIERGKVKPYSHEWHRLSRMIKKKRKLLKQMKDAGKTKPVGLRWDDENDPIADINAFFEEREK